MKTYQLSFPTEDIQLWASRYDDPAADEVPFDVGVSARSAGFLTRDQFLSIARWKTPRSGPRCAQNAEEYVVEVTRAALQSTVPRFKIEVLRMLDGVDWPTASVILHFCDAERWPIVDFRALETLGIRRRDAKSYTFESWSDYTAYARRLADSAGVSMRTLDRALWSYSKLADSR